jgi:septum formation protein
MMSTDKAFDLYLASGSPRRRELLTQMGIQYQVVQAPIDETPLPKELPREYVQRLALAKALAGRAVATTAHPVLGADTTVVLDDTLLGKPHDIHAGLAMLRQLSGRAHTVLTAVALAAADQAHMRLNVSRVIFRPLSEAEIVAYWHSGEPQDKAGGYAVQGRAAAFIERIEGSYSGIMGLPLFETCELLQTVGIDAMRNREA